MTLYLRDADLDLHQGDALEVLRTLPDESVHCCVTSPPYWGLRSYAGVEPITWPNGWTGCLGGEPKPELYVENLVAIFREVRRVLRKDGTCWLNIGDSYYANWGSVRAEGGAGLKDVPRERRKDGARLEKQLVGAPWRVALALQEDGWYLRSDVVWSKPNPMPESVTDRPTRSHEYVFFLARGRRYFFDQEAVREGYQQSSLEREKYGHNNAYGSQFAGSPTDKREGKTLLPGEINSKARGPDGRMKTTVKGQDGSIQHRDGERWPNSGRNIRSVWDIATQPFSARALPGGAPRTVSPDCPVHGDRPVPAPTESDGEREGTQASRTPRTDIRPDQEPLAALVPTEPHPEPSSAPSSSDSQPLDDSQPATSRSRRTRKTPSRSTERGTASEETPDRTLGIEPSCESSEQGGSEVPAQSETLWRTPDKCSCSILTDHFATYPEELVRRCILAGFPEGGTVLDPFGGSGTTAVVARKHGRRSILVELSLDYCALAARRLQQLSLLTEIA